VANANLATDRDHTRPFNFASEESSYTIGLRFDGPLNRLTERNIYRASLIAYQQAKRAYIESCDTIEFTIRSDLRGLKQLRVSFEISRQQLLAAARQYENARLILLGPRDRRSANDTTTLNLLRALDSLLLARNALTRNYIRYEQQRVQFLLDLEELQLDQRGFPREGPRLGDVAGGDRAIGDAAPAVADVKPAEATPR
jgi:outer membrane protein TolC